MAIHWAYESADLRDDPVSGARIRQLTSAAAISNNIYGEQPAAFEAPRHFFNHISASRCGRYFVADAHTGKGLFDNGASKPVELVVGNLETGRFRTLVQDPGGTGGGNQCTHTHPYLTADNRYVIYNANPCGGVPQVYAARLAPGFLTSLD